MKTSNGMVKYISLPILIVGILFFSCSTDKDTVEIMEELIEEESIEANEETEENTAEEEEPEEEEPVEEDPVEEDPVEEDPVEEDPVEEDPVEEDPEDGTLISDELSGDYTTCNEGFSNPDRLAPDLENRINVGDIDDRTCYSNYSESQYNGKTWGVYNITAGSNHFGGTLQPRMERSFRKVDGTDVGTYLKLTGTVRLLEVGYTGVDSRDGTYFMQVKGKHTGGGGSPEPAICLYLAKPVIENGEQVSFNVYREQIKFRGGEGGNGRDIIFLTNIKKNQEVSIELESGFRLENGNKVHYADAVIDGKAFNWNIPEPERAIEAKIRYGAYRVVGERAQIRWGTTTLERKD